MIINCHNNMLSNDWRKWLGIALGMIALALITYYFMIPTLLLPIPSGVKVHGNVITITGLTARPR